MTPDQPESPSSDAFVDIAELIARLRRGLATIAGLTLLGLALGLIAALVAANRESPVSTLRVTFGFPGFERGLYPNGSKFQPDDLRSPDVINEAIKLLGPENVSPNLSSRLREAIVVSGLMSPTVLKERDRLRATGQALPTFIPDEYEISLALSRGILPDPRQRERLLAAIVSVYHEKFSRSYAVLPPHFGNPFPSLANADFVEYELILQKAMGSLTEYLDQQIGRARQFRSPLNNLSFFDLRNESELFAQVRMKDVLGLIYINNLSKDRLYALTKMDYHIHALEEQEHRLKEEETVVAALLNKTQDRTSNYVLAGKTQGTSAQPLVDQPLLDSLVANDSYNFLVRKALEAGLAVKRVQSEKTQLFDRRQRMETVVKDQTSADLITKTKASLDSLEASYKELLSKVSTCLADYARQEYADAVRITMPPSTPSNHQQTQFGAILGTITGLALGLGLSLLGLTGTAKRKV